MAERTPPSAEQEPPVGTPAAPARRAATRRTGAKKVTPGTSATGTSGTGTGATGTGLTGTNGTGSGGSGLTGAGVPRTQSAAADPVAFPVRAGEDPWTPPELDALRNELSSELERLTRDVATLETSIAEVLRDSGDGAGDDTADTGSKAFEREQEMTLLANARETRFQTQRALQAVEDGTYGRCESCAEAIGKARLQAFPRATLCVSCKQRQERR